MQRFLINTTFLDDDNLPFAKCSVTHEMLDSVQKLKKPSLDTRKWMVNFETYAKDHYDSFTSTEKEMKPTYITSYKAHYKKPRQMYKRVKDCRRLELMEPDPQFNKRAENDFCRRTVPEGKFLDDHFYNVTEQRKKIDFIRQIRNQTYLAY